MLMKKTKDLKFFDNEVYSVTEEQLRQWLDEELAFLSYVTEGLFEYLY